jgi:hypothetical protein
MERVKGGREHDHFRLWSGGPSQDEVGAPVEKIYASPDFLIGSRFGRQNFQRTYLRGREFVRSNNNTLYYTLEDDDRGIDWWFPGEKLGEFT